MIMVSGYSYDIYKIINEYSEDSIERQLLIKMSASNEKYQYDSLDQLKFELNLRREIVHTAIALDNSQFSFADFANSKCNTDYWDRTDSGGFRLKETAKPGEAINDIFINSNKYSTECSTAIMIIYYKGLLNIYGDKLFNKLFSQIYLMNWNISEPLLKEVGITKETEDILLGDRGYFPNPDFDPETPEWQGENVIVLPYSMYYGHGIGITTSDRIIHELNSKRKEGATQSAFFLNKVGRPNFIKLADAFNNPSLYASQPVSQATPQYTTQPTSRTAPQYTSQTVSQPITHPASRPAFQPDPQPVSQPVSQASPQLDPQSISQPTSQPISHPVSRPAFQPDPQPVSQPVSQPGLQPAFYPASQTVPQPISYPASQPASQPDTQPVSQPVTLSGPQPAFYPASQPDTRPVSQPVSQPISHPASQPASQPDPQPVSQPVSQPEPEPQPEPKPTPLVWKSFPEPISKG